MKQKYELKITKKKIKKKSLKRLERLCPYGNVKKAFFK